MNKPNILVGVLIGLIIVLVGVILVQDSRNNIAIAAQAGGGNDAATPRGVGLGSNGVIAVTGQYAQYNSVLYLVDTNREVILTYACYGKSRGALATAFRTPYLTFLNGRLYTYDADFAVKSPNGYGNTEGPKPRNMRDLLKNADKEE
jgi:hypothetical protein